MKIMYVEDNLANFSLVKRVARMGGHEVLSYIVGEDALKNYEHDRPDLILMDLQLAGEMHGLEVVKKLREKGYQTPIVAVTAYAMVGDRERCIEAGCNDYIAKPLPVPQLVELFARYSKPKAI
jgi:CheY-like chemotaxis protein